MKSIKDVIEGVQKIEKKIAELSRQIERINTFIESGQCSPVQIADENNRSLEAMIFTPVQLSKMVVQLYGALGLDLDVNALDKQISMADGTVLSELLKVKFSEGSINGRGFDYTIRKWQLHKMVHVVIEMDVSSELILKGSVSVSQEDIKRSGVDLSEIGDDIRRVITSNNSGINAELEVETEEMILKVTDKNRSSTLGSEKFTAEFTSFLR